MLTQFMYLGMAVMAAGNAVVGTGGLDLVILQLPISQALFFIPGLQKTTPAATAVVVGSVGLHVDKIIFANDRFDHKAQILGNGVTITFTHDLTRILDCKFDFEVFIPIGIDFEFALPDPLGVVLINIFDFKTMVDVKFFQSFQD